jgi:hypothetical protein
MTKWLKTPKTYGGKEDNEKMERSYRTPIKKEKHNMKKIVKIIGYVIAIAGIVTVGISVFYPTNTLAEGIIAMAVGAAMASATESPYGS